MKMVEIITCHIETELMNDLNMVRNAYLVTA